MKIASLLATLGLATIFVATPACEMQRPEDTVKGYGEEHEAETREGAAPDATNPAPPTYFQE